MQEPSDISPPELLRMTAEVASAYVSNNSLPASQLSEMIRAIHESLSNIGVGKSAKPEQTPVPAVPVKKSVTPDYIVCLEDGKKLKMLKRHLRTTYNMTPDAYRARWALPPDYPMVAPSYATRRSSIAKQQDRKSVV